MSLRLYNELEVVQTKKSQLEWENEVLRERTQELEVTKQVLQAELDKIREVSLRASSVCECVCVYPSASISPLWNPPLKSAPIAASCRPHHPDGHVTHDPGAER